MKCYIESLAALKMKYYVDSVNAEISGVGKTRMEGEDIYVEDVIIFKQKCSGAHTDLDQEDEMRIMFERDQRGESSKDWNLWWHSHNTMGVFWSSTDNNNIVDQAGGGSYLLSIVTNKKGQFKTRFDIFPKDVSPLHIVTYYKVQDDIETIIIPQSTDPVRQAELQKFIEEVNAKQELDDLETDKKYKIVSDEIDEQIKQLEAAKVEQDRLCTLDKDTREEKLQEKFRGIIDEYKQLCSKELEDDEVLREQIKQEVLTKVTVPIEFPQYNTGFLGFKKKKKFYEKLSRDGGLDYDDIYYGQPYYQQSFDNDDTFQEKLDDVKNSIILDPGYEMTKTDEDLLLKSHKPNFIEGFTV